jgi:hypothetical protein
MKKAAHLAVPLSLPLRNRIRPDTKTPNKRKKKISTSTQLFEVLYTNSQNMPALPSTVASHYYNCCTDGRPIQEIMDT